MQRSSQNSPLRALVLGGATGLLGQAIVAQLKRRQGWHVQTLGRGDCNLFSKDVCASKLSEMAPDVVFNTVAYTQVDDAEEHEALARSVNRDFPAMLASLLAESSPSSVLVQYSTDFVFGGCAVHPYTEEDQPAPESVYGHTKYEGEQAVLSTLPNRSLILRTAWLFGPYRKNFVTTILNAAKTRTELTVVEDQVGSPTYTLDLADWSIRLVQLHEHGLWHTVNAGHASWYELARTAVALAHLECAVRPIPSQAWPQKAKRPSYSVLNQTKLSDLLGEPPRSWKAALTEFVTRQLR